MANNIFIAGKGKNSPKNYSSHNQVCPAEAFKFVGFIKSILPFEECVECIVP